MNDSHKLLWPEQPWAMSRVSLLGRLHWNVSCHTNQWEGEAKNVWCGGFNVQCGVVNCRHTCACTHNTHLHAYMLTHANTCAHKLTHTHTHKRARANTHKHTHSHIHTHTLTTWCVLYHEFVQVWKEIWISEIYRFTLPSISAPHPMYMYVHTYVYTHKLICKCLCYTIFLFTPDVYLYLLCINVLTVDARVHTHAHAHTKNIRVLLQTRPDWELFYKRDVTRGLSRL